MEVVIFLQSLLCKFMSFTLGDKLVCSLQQIAHLSGASRLYIPKCIFYYVTTTRAKLLKQSNITKSQNFKCLIYSYTFNRNVSRKILCLSYNLYLLELAHSPLFLQGKKTFSLSPCVSLPPLISTPALQACVPFIHAFSQ